MEKLKSQLILWFHDLTSLIRQSFEKRPALAWAFVVGFLVFVIFVSDRNDAEAKPSEPTQSERVDAVDTFIPAGYVLVPIEVINYESLDSVLGHYGVVDLFAADPANGGQSRQVASRIKILRAPKNPSQFAVLAPESESPALVKHVGGFYVVIQNPKSAGTSFETPRAKVIKKSRLKVEFNDE